MLTVLDPTGQDEAKRAYVGNLGPEKCVCIGNRRNDRLMLKDAALGIAVIHLEGMATEAALAGDLLVTGIHDALDLLLAPKRLIATLRS
jgi:soluble P-type ATPase